MKAFLSTLFTLAFGGAMMLTIVCLPATAQILFQDDFSKAATSEKKWAFLQGKWTVKGSGPQTRCSRRRNRCCHFR